MKQERIETSRSVVIPSYAWVVLAVAFIASVAAPLNQNKVPPLMPILMDAFQLDLGQAGLLMSVFAFTGVLLALPAGIITQQWGFKVTGTIAMAGLVLGAALGALAPTAALLLASRVLEGVGMGLIAVVAPAAIAAWFPPEKQGAPMGIWATWVPVGSVLMYNLAPAMATAHGWQAVWRAGALFALLALGLYWLLMRVPPTPADPVPQQDVVSNLRQALANRDIWLLALAFGCFNLAFGGLPAYYPTFLSTVRGMSLAQAGSVASITTMVVLGAAPLAGWLSDRLNTRRWVMVLPFLVISGLLLLPFNVTGDMIYVYLVLQGAFVGAVPSAIFATAPEVMARPEQAGIGLSLIMLGQNLGMVIGPALFGKLVEAIGWAPSAYCMIPISLLGAFAAWRVKVR